MTRPGMRLRALAAHVCSSRTLERIVDPILADLQHEYSRAVVERRRWKAVWVRIGGYAGFTAAMVLHAGGTLHRGGRAQLAADEGAIARALTAAAVVMILVTGIMVAAAAWLSGGSGRPVRVTVSPWALWYLIPQGVPIAIPASLLIAALAGAASGPVTARLRKSMLFLVLIGSIGSGVFLGWITPTANQAFRVMIFGALREPRPPLVPAKGPNEMTWQELHVERARVSAMSRPREMRLMTLAYHLRLALAIAPLLFGFLGLQLVRPVQRARLAKLLALAGLVAYSSYYTAFNFTIVGNGSLSPVAVAWTPDIVALGLIGVLRVLRSERLLVN